MRKMTLAWVAVLLVSAPAWATGLNQTCNIGLYNPCMMMGGCIPTPCPSPCFPCVPFGACQVTSNMMAVTSCQMTGPCGSVGMLTQSLLSTSIGCTPCTPAAVMTASMTILGPQGNLLLETHLP
jgi:hypothetical protein